MGEKYWKLHFFFFFFFFFFFLSNFWWDIFQGVHISDKLGRKVRFGCWLSYHNPRFSNEGSFLLMGGGCGTV